MSEIQTLPRLEAAVQMVTPADAVELITKHRFPRQRHTRMPWVMELADILAMGCWAPTTITIAHCEEDDRDYLVDGYHRCQAIYTAMLPAPLLIFRQTCATMNDVGILYSRLDRGLPRSLADGLIARDLTTETGFSVKTLRAAVSAVNIIRSEFRTATVLSRKRSNDEKFDSLTQWIEALRTYETAISTASESTKRKLRLAPLMAVALTICRYQPEKGERFFREIANNDMLQVGMPQHTFFNKFIVSDRSEIAAAGTIVICRWAVSCWNAYYESRFLSRVTSDPAPRPLNFVGTPYAQGKNQRG